MDRLGPPPPALLPGPRPSHRGPWTSDSSPVPDVTSDHLAKDPHLPWAKATPCWASGASGPPIPLTALTLVPRPASGTEAAARVRVTEAAVEASTALLAPGSGVPREALCGGGQGTGEGHLLGQGYDPGTHPRLCTQNLGFRLREGEVRGLVTLTAEATARDTVAPQAGSQLRPQREGAAPGPRGRQPRSHRAQGPRPSSARRRPALTGLAGQAGPALPAGAAARGGVAGASVPAQAGVLAALAVQTRGAGWGRRGQQRAAPPARPTAFRTPPPPGGPARSPTSERGCGPRPLSPGQLPRHPCSPTQLWGARPCRVCPGS